MKPECEWCPKESSGPHYYYCRTTGQLTQEQAAALVAKDEQSAREKLCFGGPAHPHTARERLDQLERLQAEGPLTNAQIRARRQRG